MNSLSIDEIKQLPSKTKIRNKLSNFMRNTPLFFGTLIVTFVILITVFGPVIAPFDPIEHNYSETLASPNQKHLLGTDKFGRDIFSRILFATRIDLLIGVLCVLFPFFIGVYIGMISGYYGGAIDAILMRLVDLVVAFPFFVLIIAIIAILGPGIRNMYVAITIAGWISYAKIMRGEILIAKNHEYVLAARALGYSNTRIMWRHLLPNALPPCIIFAMTDVILCILSAAGLGFLGLGVQPPTPEWGVMIADGREFIATAWWISAFPGFAIAVVGIGFSLLGDGLVNLMRRQNV